MWRAYTVIYRPFVHDSIHNTGTPRDLSTCNRRRLCCCFDAWYTVHLSFIRMGQIQYDVVEKTAELPHKLGHAAITITVVKGNRHAASPLRRQQPEQPSEISG